MNIVQQKLVNSYATLVITKVFNFEEVPEVRLIGGTEYPIRCEVEVEVNRRIGSFL